MKKFLIALCGLLTTACISYATVKPNNIFSNNMVLQRNAAVKVWGWAEKDEKVTLEFNGQKLSTVAKEGKWFFTLSPMKENSNPQTMTIGGNNVITINNILIGEVWVTSGQSNMEWALAKSNGGDSAIANAKNEMLRIFNVPHNVKMSPDSNISSKWFSADPSSVKSISAVGYWFLSKLQKELGVPVGFINVAFGGTVIESWMSKEALEKMPIKDKNMSLDSAKEEYDARLEKIRPIIEAYEKAKDSAKKAKAPAPPRPPQIPSEFKGPTTIYNGEIFPLAPYTIKGIAWYQGESNAYPGRANTYSALLPTMIELWRSLWEIKDLPFIIIQLSGDRKLQTQPVENSGIAVIREAQLNTTKSVPYTCLVTTNDCGELDVHYKNKKPIGERVCNAALNLAYNKKIEYTGPLYQGMKINNGKVVIEFSHIGSGLIVKKDSVKTETLYGFAIAGNDKKFFWANAVIEGNKVIVSSPDVPSPVAVRYGWADFSNKWNLYNKEGYPASTFRTDDWALEK